LQVFFLRKDQTVRLNFFFMRNLLANTFITLGIVLIIIAGLLLWQRYNPQRLAFSDVGNEISESINEEKNLPVALKIEDLDIKLPVFPARSQTGKWETTTKGVSYLVSSAMPGQVGNSIFYGHNYKNILGNLKNAKPGQIIEVKLANGVWRKFRIEYVQTVAPNQTGILDQTDDKRLTLYTCTGFLDSKRLVVTALFTP